MRVFKILEILVLIDLMVHLMSSMVSPNETYENDQFWVTACGKRDLPTVGEVLKEEF
jgi:hypothetical protein